MQIFLSCFVLIVTVLQVSGVLRAQEMGSFSSAVQKSAKAPVELKLKDNTETRKSIRFDPPSDIEIQTLKKYNSGKNSPNGDSTPKKKALQIGFGRAVSPAISNTVSPKQLNWQTLTTGGLAAQFTVASTNAAALRIALAVKKMPPGVELRFVGSKNPNVILGPISAEHVLKQAPYWSPMVDGDSITVEIYLPPGVTSDGLDFSLVNISHMLSSPVKLNMNALQIQVASAQAASASCELDAVCFYNNAAVQSTATSVAKMIFTEPSSGLSYLCTGTLLNSLTPSVPYFYGANHCISDQATANTLQTFWFYESTACNGLSLKPSSVTLINGADLLYNDAANDVSFLRLVDPAPAGAIFAAWNATPIAAGTSSIGLHHPQGDFKKISLGTTTGQIASFGNLPPGGSYNAIVNNQGVTEGGSSGSGLFILSNAMGEYQLRGGLWGGASSCSNPSGADYYSRFDLAYPRISGYLYSAQTDVRTYVPAAAANGGYVSYLRVINKGNISTPITLSVIDGTSGLIGASGTLTASLPAQAAVTYTAQQVEAALGVTLLASDRPRIRVIANTSIDAQSFLLQPGGVFNETSDAQAGHSAILVRTYVPVAAAPSGYMSYLRIINVGTAATPITVAKIDPITGQTGPTGTLTASLPQGAAITVLSSQVEAALGSPIASNERPRILVTGINSLLDVQSFLLQPGRAFTNVSSGQKGKIIDVRSYIPAATIGYASYIRVINGGTVAAPVTVALLDDVTGVASAASTLIASLPANAATTLSSSQVETALGMHISPTSRPRIRISSSVTLVVQSFLLQPGGAFNEVSNASSGTIVDVRTYVPAADSGSGYASYLRVINTGITATPVTVALVDGITGAVSGARTLIASLPAGGASSFTPSQIEAALGTAIAPGNRPQIRISGNTVLEVQSFLTQPGGAFTEISGGQSGPN